jgi:hypothetical protein
MKFIWNVIIYTCLIAPIADPHNTVGIQLLFLLILIAVAAIDILTWFKQAELQAWENSK